MAVWARDCGVWWRVLLLLLLGGVLRASVTGVGACSVSVPTASGLGIKTFDLGLANYGRDARTIYGPNLFLMNSCHPIQNVTMACAAGTMVCEYVLATTLPLRKLATAIGNASLSSTGDVVVLYPAGDYCNFNRGYYQALVTYHCSAAERIVSTGESPTCTFNFAWYSPAGCGTTVCNVGRNGSDCTSCADGYFGPNCTDCALCAPHGTCVDGANGSCVCSPGFAGPTCADCAPGHFGPNCTSCTLCAPNGNCTSGLDGSCTCNNAWTGPTCETCADGFGPSCVACSSCLRGTCVPGPGGSCACFDGWNGTQCDACSSDAYGPLCSPCAVCDAHGTCEPGLDGQCQCDPYFAGLDCSRCDPGRFGPTCADCGACSIHGVCDPGIGGSCTCNAGWTGSTCDETAGWSSAVVIGVSFATSVVAILLVTAILAFVVKSRRQKNQQTAPLDAPGSSAVASGAAIEPPGPAPRGAAMSSELAKTAPDSNVRDLRSVQ